MVQLCTIQMNLNLLTDDSNIYQIIKFMMDRHGSARYSELRTLTKDPVNMHIKTFHEKLEELREKKIIERNGGNEYTRPRVYRLSSKTLQMMDPCLSHLRELIKNMETDKNFINDEEGQRRFQSEIKKIFEILLEINLIDATCSKKMKKISKDKVSFDNGLHFILKIILDEVSMVYNKMVVDGSIINENNLKRFVSNLKIDEDESWIKETFSKYLSNYFSSPLP